MMRGSWDLRILAVALGLILGLGLLDYRAIYPGLLWWLMTVPLMIGFGLLCLRRKTKTRLFVVAVVGLWVVTLPSVRWGPRKPFYIDCLAIDDGSLLGEVREAMREYHLQKDIEEEVDHDGVSASIHAEILFHPALGYSADWCRVHARDGRVVGVGISPD